MPAAERSRDLHLHKEKHVKETVKDGSAHGQQKISNMFCTFSAFTCLFLAGEKNVDPSGADMGKIWPATSLKKNKSTKISLTLCHFNGF